MAGASRTVRELAHHLHADEPLVGRRSPRSGVPTPTTRTTHRPRSPGIGQHLGQGPPRRDRALKTRGPQAIGRSRGGLTTKIHMVAADARTAITYALSPGQDHDAPHGRELLKQLGPPKKKPGGEQLQLFLVPDRAYEGTETRQLAFALGYTPVIPPKSNRRHPCDYNRRIYKRRNEVERLFRRLKEYRRVFTRYDKLDVIFLAFITLALIHDTLRSVNTP